MTHVILVVIHVSAMGFSARVLPPEPRHRVAFESLRDCRAVLPAVRRTVGVAASYITRISCERIEVRL